MATTSGRGRSIVRLVSVWVLAVLTVVSTLAAVTVLWAQRTLLDTEEFVAMVGPLVDEPEVRDALAARVDTAVVEALRLDEVVPGLLEQVHPAAVVLTGPVVNSAEQMIEDAVVAVVDSETFATLWKGTVEVSHTRALALLRDDAEDLGNLAISEQGVTLDLLPVIAAAIQRAAAGLGDLLGVDLSLPRIEPGDDPVVSRERLATALGIALPEGYGQVTVMSAADLATAQRTYRMVTWLGPVLVILALLCGAAAVWLSVKRGRTLALLGVGIAAALLLARAALSRLEAALLERIVDGQTQEAVTSVLAKVGSSAGEIAWQVLLVAVIAVAMGLLVGRSTAP